MDQTTTSVALVNGSATATFTGLTAGAHTVTATYTSSDGFTSAATAPVTLTVAPTQPSVALALLPPAPAGGAPQGLSQTFTATLTGAVSPTGSVAFLDGNSTLTTVPVANGAASYTTSSLAPGYHSITAKYMGDANNAAATSAAITFTTIAAATQGFNLPAGPIGITLPSGGQGTATLGIIPNPDYAGTVTFSCSNLPSSLTCAFSPASLTFTPTVFAAQSTTLTLNASSSASLQPPPGSSSLVAFASLLGFPAALLFWMRRKNVEGRNARLLPNLLALLLLLAASAGILGIQGCGGSSHSINSYTFQVNATDGTNTRTVTVVANVTH